MQGVQVRSLVGELRSHMPRSVAKKFKKIKLLKEGGNLETRQGAQGEGSEYRLSAYFKSIGN